MGRLAAAQVSATNAGAAQPLAAADPSALAYCIIMAVAHPAADHAHLFRASQVWGGPPSMDDGTCETGARAAPQV